PPRIHGAEKSETVHGLVLYALVDGDVKGAAASVEFETKVVKEQVSGTSSFPRPDIDACSSRWGSRIDRMLRVRCRRNGQNFFADFCSRTVEVVDAHTGPNRRSGHFGPEFECDCLAARGGYRRTVVQATLCCADHGCVRTRVRIRRNRRAARVRPSRQSVLKTAVVHFPAAVNGDSNAEVVDVKASLRTCLPHPDSRAGCSCGSRLRYRMKRVTCCRNGKVDFTNFSTGSVEEIQSHACPDG